ncbi:hypothetical protein IID24_03880 [Patescibacteria group bacterium]|nr:hypothetical protein [Patescibacteria group bacterium]
MFQVNVIRLTNIVPGHFFMEITDADWVFLHRKSQIFLKHPLKQSDLLQPKMSVRIIP